MFDNLLRAMNLDDEEEEYYDDDLYEEDDIEDEVVEKRPSLFGKKNKDEFDEPERKSISKITPIRRSQGKGVSNSMEVCVIKPTSFDDSREIAETLLNDHTVILNMEGLNVGVAQRIIDFTCGACYAIDGSLQKVNNYIFIVTPSGVDLSGDFQSLADAFDYSGIQI